MKLFLKAGQTYSICSCGYSKMMPICDNTHRSLNTENCTDYKSIKITSDVDANIQLSSSRWDVVDGEDK